MNREKPVVYFVGEPRWDTELFHGNEVANVRTINHYVWGKDMVRTSVVLNKFPDGSFETMNTIYKPSKNEIY
jgi:phosphoglycerol transferase MdoB-like AlkP superfamily enzyme